MKKIFILLAMAFAATGCSSTSFGQQKWEYRSLVLGCIAYPGGDPVTGLQCLPVFEDKLTDQSKPRPIDEVLTEMGAQSWELVSTDVQIEGGLGPMPRGEMQKYLYSMVFKRRK